MGNQNRIMRKNDDIIFEEIKEGGALLYNNATKETHILNETATLIFKCCDGKELTSSFCHYINFFQLEQLDETLQQRIKQDFLKTIEIFRKKSIISEVLETY